MKAVRGKTETIKDRTVYVYLSSLGFAIPYYSDNAQANLQLKGYHAHPSV